MRMPILLPLAAVFLASNVAAQAAGVSSAQSPGARELPPTIVASGEGRRDVAPDKATIVLGVETRARTPGAAGSANAERMTAIRNALTRAGVGERDISTARYSLHLQMGRTEADTQYVASNLITIQTRRLNEVGRLIDLGLGAGANTIASLQYDLTDRTDSYNAALAEAVTNARRQADVMARAAGGRLGDLVELTTQPGSYQPFFAAEASMRMAASAAPTPVSPGAVSVSASVTGRWHFIPGR